MYYNDLSPKASCYLPNLGSSLPIKQDKTWILGTNKYLLIKPSYCSTHEGFRYKESERVMP
jgi:hypothetical protein